MVRCRLTTGEAPFRADSEQGAHSNGRSLWSERRGFVASRRLQQVLERSGNHRSRHYVALADRPSLASPLTDWADEPVSQSAVNGGSEHVSDPTGLLTEDMGINPQCDRRIGVAETSRDDVDGHAGK